MSIHNENKLRSPVSHVKYEPGMYNKFPPGALVIVDWRTADQLDDATIRAVQTGTFKRIRVLMILNASTLASKGRLLRKRTWRPTRPRELVPGTYSCV